MLSTKLRSSGARTYLRLFCFPYAGGSLSIFSNWEQYLIPGLETYPVSLSGRAMRFKERRIERMQPLIKNLARFLKPLFSVPFAFYGHSMGALVSFELARYLRENELPLPVHLFVSACP